MTTPTLLASSGALCALVLQVHGANPVQPPPAPAPRGIAVVDLRRTATKKRPSRPLPVLQVPLRTLVPFSQAQLAAALRNQPPPPVSDPTPSTPPAPLPAPTGTFMTVIPGSPWVGGKGGMSADYPAFYGGGQVFLRPLTGQAPGLNFEIRSEGTFLLDFAVAVLEPGTVFTISSTWAGPQQVALPASGDIQHLIVATTIPPKPPEVQYIEWKTRLEGSRQFSFYSMTAYTAQ